jgi:hypothetical protein
MNILRLHRTDCHPPRLAQQEQTKGAEAYNKPYALLALQLHSCSSLSRDHHGAERAFTQNGGLRGGRGCCRRPWYVRFQSFCMFGSHLHFLQLALQGAFAEHETMLLDLRNVKGKRVVPIQVREPDDLARCDALIIPGGGKFHCSSFSPAILWLCRIDDHRPPHPPLLTS